MINRNVKRIRRGRRLRLERLDARLVLASVTGVVFEDLDLSATHDTGEPLAADRLVYADANGNGRFDAGEASARTAASGAYSLTGLPAGDYRIRLFQGNALQQQTTPYDITADTDPISATEPSVLTSLDDGGIFFFDSSGDAVRIDSAGAINRITLERTVIDAAELADGTVFVVFAPAAGEDSGAILNFATGTIESAAVAAAGQPVVQAVSTTTGGRGLMIVDDNGQRQLRTLDSSGGGLTTGDPGLSLQENSYLLDGGSSASKIGIVTDHENTADFRIWNTATSSLELDASVADIESILAFDAENGWLLTADDEGGRSVRDIGQAFSNIQSLSQTSGPAVFDSSRKLLFSFASDSEALVGFNILDGTTHAYPEALSEQGTVSQMLFAASGQRILLASATALHRVNASAPIGHAVSLNADSELANIDFGVKLHGLNTAPTGDPNVAFSVVEDNPLTIPVGGLFGTASDPDGDPFVAVVESGPNHGTIVIRPDGSAIYEPNANFSGVDEIGIVLLDGVAASDVITVPIDVTAVDDAPSGFQLQLDPIGEHARAGTLVGTISVIDPDPDDSYTITVDDPRFEIVGNEVRRASQGIINFEEKSQIDVVFKAVHQTDGTIQIVRNETVQVADENDPITGINLPPILVVPENVLPGQPIIEIVVFDEDQSDQHVVEIIDDRFAIVDGNLQLQEGVKLDFEDELPDVVITFVAREVGGDDDIFTQDVTVTVGDENDPPTGIAVNSASVMEQVPGAEIAPVSFSDQDENDTHTFTIDDDRFEIVDGVLKLKEGTVVLRSEETVINLTITVTDSGNPPLSTTTQTQVVVLENASPYHNGDLPGDVNGDGSVTPEDAIVIINELNQNGPGSLAGQIPGGYLYDVNNDGFITPIDVLIIINLLNRTSLPGPASAEAGFAAEVDPPAADPPSLPPQANTDRALTQVVDSLDPPAAADELVNEQRIAPTIDHQAEIDLALAAIGQADEEEDELQDGPVDLWDPLSLPLF